MMPCAASPSRARRRRWRLAAGPRSRGRPRRRARSAGSSTGSSRRRPATSSSPRCLRGARSHPLPGRIAAAAAQARSAMTTSRWRRRHRPRRRPCAAAAREPPPRAARPGERARCGCAPQDARHSRRPASSAIALARAAGSPGRRCAPCRCTGGRPLAACGLRALSRAGRAPERRSARRWRSATAYDARLRPRLPRPPSSRRSSGRIAGGGCGAGAAAGDLCCPPNAICATPPETACRARRRQPRPAGCLPCNRLTRLRLSAVAAQPAQSAPPRLRPGGRVRCAPTRVAAGHTSAKETPRP